MRNLELKNCIWLICGWDKNDQKYIDLLMPSFNELAKKLSCKVIVLFMNQYKTCLDDIRAMGQIVINTEVSDASIDDQIEYINGLLNIHEPLGVFFIKSVYSQVVAAKLSIMLKKGLVAECIDVIYDEFCNYKVIRTSLSHGAFVTIGFKNCEYGMAIIRPELFNYKESEDEFAKLHIINERICRSEKNNSITIFGKEEKIYTETNKLRKVILIAGMGLDNREKIEKFCYLAELINADIGCSRAVAENGLLDKRIIVGQSGRVIKHDICITFGVSGAIQHICGIKSKCVIAINTDENADIFNYADYKMISDANLIIDKLISILDRK